MNHGYKSSMQRLVNTLYRRIYHEDMSMAAGLFLKNLLNVGIGTGIATLFATIFMILGGRLLGPGEYGKFSLVQSVANFLILPMALSYSQGMIKYISGIPDKKNQSDIIMTSYMIILFLSTVSVALYLVFASSIAQIIASFTSTQIGLSTDLFYFAVIFAAFYVLYIHTTSVLRGLSMMRVFSIFQGIFAVLLLVIFFIFIICKQTSYKAMVYPMFIAYGINVIFISILYVRKYFKLNFSIPWAKILTKYSVIAVVGAVAYVFYTNIDRIFLSKYLSVSEVGIYSAYYLGSLNTIMLVWGIFNNVFFPAVSAQQDKSIAFRKINKSVPYLFIIGIPVLLLVQYIVLLFYGSQYKIDIILMLLFSVASICSIIQATYAWLLNSEGPSGAWIASLTAIVAAIINVVLNFFLIPILGIHGAAVSLVATYFAATVTVLVLGYRYMKT
jgi:O-antigen/teichoic acid export membrane protein